ncbi:N-6 DNA methylase [Streptomyces sp. DH24]|uniref:N-6 DNA methylase n=1 Tax=Streptomyces sp. DH24 TaxID=3040123 RepID=UPI002442B333|nr:N-6 DNA methylase [Streptomyces sp. DH24]MDG9718862.1 N-6 DNA methylase [Streptomyces sp. DH24]
MTAHPATARCGPGATIGLVLANPPFGKKSSITVHGDDGSAAREAIAYERRDFWVTTTNKQLNFVQHIASLLEIHGRAAVVVPDNVLFLRLPYGPALHPQAEPAHPGPPR